MKETATFAAGCFWHVQETFDNVSGVVSSRVGYSGGEGEGDYEGSEGRGHAEAVEVVFDSRLVSYDKLLKIFWEGHDPTSLNRQGLDFGNRYRSAIFYHCLKQKKAALESLRVAQKEFKGAIVTEIVPASRFCEAEEEHQKYYEKHGKVC